ncbi:alpha/beta hydrolase [Anabaena sphaerica FACHB-251]|uniref:Alpha/beta hydrolase n=1 Tax=Anabaena sphaerica FACHB-251 TaxID=2692883 RepID=A0A926WIK5_9NOST|nr:alpha/beta hydrolase [Anabaena sphaerica]MBD2294752.1 alpha/beta hydrolase [Anabaena sphaerica FACHB-251]
MDTLFRNSRRKLSQGLLFWREIGKGTPVVLLHGAWNDSSQWVSIMNLLSQYFHCFAPDLLGFSESENPNIHHSINLQVECLAELLQALKLEKIYLVGDSLGAWIAASYALKYPEQVSGLALLEPEGVKVAEEEQNWHKMQRLVNFSPLVVKLLRLLTPLIKLIGWEQKITENLQLRQKLLQYPTACQLLFNRKQPEIEAELLNNRLYSLEVPCLILQGGQDTANAQAKSNTYARMIPKAELKIIAHGENNLPESCAGIVVGYIRDFVKEN